MFPIYFVVTFIALLYVSLSHVFVIICYIYICDNVMLYIPVYIYVYTYRHVFSIIKTFVSA